MNIANRKTLSNGLNSGFLRLFYSTNALPKVKIQYGNKLQAKLKASFKAKSEYDEIVSKKLVNDYSYYKQFYNISAISKQESKKYAFYENSVVVNDLTSLDVKSDIKFFNKQNAEVTPIKSVNNDVKVVVDDQFDVKLGTLTAYLTGKGYTFEAYNLRLKRQDNDSFVTLNNSILAECTGLSSSYVKFKAKNSIMNYKDTELIKTFKENVNITTHLPNSINFLKFSEFYLVIKNSQLLIFSKNDSYQKNRKELNKLFNSLNKYIDSSPSADFYFMDVKSNSFSSASIITSLLKEVFTKEKEEILNSMIMKYKSNRDVVDTLTSYSPSNEYTFKLIELLDTDMKDEYKARIKKLKEPDTKEIIEKLQLICRTEPEMHYMTSILSNFKDVKFTCVLTVYLWKTLLKLKTLKPNVISYDLLLENLGDVQYKIPQQIDQESSTISVFTDASLNNEISATGQIYYINNRIAYMQSTVDNKILSYIDSAELHAVVTAAEKTTSIKSFISEFIKQSQEFETVFYVDNTSVLNALSLHQNQTYDQNNLKHYQYLNSVELDDIKMLYVPSECNVADGLTKAKFDNKLYASIWFKQFMNKKITKEQFQVDSVEKKHNYVNKVLVNFKELIEKKRGKLQSIQEMEELYEKHSNDISKKEQILFELNEIGKNCIQELKVADKVLTKLAKTHNVVLKQVSKSDNIDDLGITMQSLSKEVDYSKQLKMISTELSSKKLYLENEDKIKVPSKLKTALTARNNILNLWEVSIEEKVEEIGEYFDKRERLRFKTINDKYVSLKEIQAQKEKRFAEWKEYLINKENQNTEEANNKFLKELVASNQKMILREEKERRNQIEALKAKETLEQKRLQNEGILKESFENTLNSMMQYNKLKEESEKMPLEKQREIKRVFAELEKKRKSMEEIRQAKQAENAKKAKLLEKQNYNPEVEFENTTCFTIGYPFEKFAGIAKDAQLTAKQKAKLTSVVKIQQLEIAHKNKKEEDDLRLEQIGKKKRLIDHFRKKSYDDYLKAEEKKKNGLS
ncbi:hypothetical protein FOG50_03797 [Hanseniaspora uvarum]|nr:hypothetical protein FOG50_03797 [Hanseniaspora uvarum]